MHWLHCVLSKLGIDHYLTLKSFFIRFKYIYVVPIDPILYDVDGVVCLV